MRKAHAAAALSVALFLSGCGKPTSVADKAALRKVKFNLSWTPQGSTAGVLVAIGKGFYKEAGLEVEAVQGYGGQRTVNEIDQGLFDFGYGDPVSVILNRQQGGKTMLVGSINTEWPAGLCYVEQPGRQWQAINDLKGLTLGGGSASPLQNIVPAWLEANGFPATHIKLLRLDPAVINPSLLGGKIDLAECWEGANRPVLTSIAARDGKKIAWLRYRDFKLNLYGNGIVTTEKMIQENPDVVKRFVEATYKGYASMKQDPAGAADTILAGYKLLDRAILLQQIGETNQIVSDPGAPNPRPGWMRQDRMQSTVEFVRKAFHLAESEKGAEIYTNRFVE